MKEAYLQYIWRHKKLPFTNLKTTNKKSIEILDFGFLNANSGPDFFNGKIQLEDQVWAGNIEIHVKSSDWYAHKHHNDQVYDNVILHVVFEYDSPVFTSSGREVPTIEIRQLLNDTHYVKYEEFISNQTWVSCENQISKVDEFYTRTFLERLAVERLGRKSKQILESLERDNYNWEEVFFQYLLSSFGTSVNKDVFLQIARNTPLSIIQKIGNNEFQLEALFLGQSGLLNATFEDDYFNILRQEYQFLKQKYNLYSIDVVSVKFSKLRPSNFPTIRLVQFSKLMAKRNQWFSFALDSNLDQLKQEFVVELDQYWETHYVFGKTSDKRRKGIGDLLKHSLVVNVISPFLLIYSNHQNKPELKEKALNFLTDLPPESNGIIEKWRSVGVKVDSAFQTQALLELKNEYCSAKKCLNCSIGAKLLN